MYMAISNIIAAGGKSENEAEWYDNWMACESECDYDAAIIEPVTMRMCAMLSSAARKLKAKHYDNERY